MSIIKAWQRNSPEVSVKGFKMCCISNAMDETDDDMVRMAVKRMEMLGVSRRKMKT